MSKGIAALVVEDEEMVKKCYYYFLPRINQPEKGEARELNTAMSLWGKQ